MKRGTVRLVEHDPGWATAFLAERARLCDALAGLGCAIEHVGSTVVPGLPAKPILDIAVGVPAAIDPTACIPPLEQCGYAYRGDAGARGGHVFVRALGDVRTCHLHVVPLGSIQWAAYLALRDLLRTDDAARIEYAEAKRQLALEFAEDRRSYTDGKAKIVASLLSRAAAGDTRKRVVADGYDECASRYTAARVGDASPALAKLLEMLPAGAIVLDIGCGAGVPVTAALAEVADVVGVDISPVQLEQARRNVPQARLILGDIMTTEFPARSFDAVVAFYTLFHLPREEHRPLLERVAKWLRPGGHLLATVASSSHPGYTEADFFGVTMYWSHFEAPWYARVLQEFGFEVRAEGVADHGYREGSAQPPERHPWILAWRDAR